MERRFTHTTVSVGQLALASVSVAYWPLPSVTGFGAAMGRPRHSATNTRLVLPLAWIAALSAVHSSLHCLAVFCCATADGDRATNASDAAHSTAVKIVFIVHLRTCSAERRPGWGYWHIEVDGAGATALPNRQRHHCSLFVLFRQEQNRNMRRLEASPTKTAAPRRAP